LIVLCTKLIKVYSMLNGKNLEDIRTISPSYFKFYRRLKALWHKIPTTNFSLPTILEAKVFMPYARCNAIVEDLINSGHTARNWLLYLRTLSPRQTFLANYA